MVNIAPDITHAGLPLTQSDQELLRIVAPDRYVWNDPESSASRFAVQLAEDRASGRLQPEEDVTTVYLQSRATELDARLRGTHTSNPYRGETFRAALRHLERTGHSDDIRL